MKKIKFLLFVVLIGAVIIACGKDDNTEENPATSPLYGSWKRMKSDVSGCNNPSENNTTDCNSPGSLCSGSIEFNRTTMTSSGISGTNSTSYTINGNTFNYPSDGGVPTTFTIAGTTLTLLNQQSASNGGCLIVTTYERI